MEAWCLSWRLQSLLKGASSPSPLRAARPTSSPKVSRERCIFFIPPPAPGGKNVKYWLAVKKILLRKNSNIFLVGKLDKWGKQKFSRYWGGAGGDIKHTPGPGSAHVMQGIVAWIPHNFNTKPGAKLCITNPYRPIKKK